MRPLCQITIVGVFEPSPTDVGVDLCGGNVGVAQHFLDDPQIATVFEKVRGEAVPQRLRRNAFGDARGTAQMCFDITARC